MACELAELMWQPTSGKLHIWPLGDTLQNIMLWQYLLLCVTGDENQSICKVRTTLKLRSRHWRRGWRHLEFLEAEKSMERLFKEVRFKDRFGCVKTEAQFLNRSQLLLRCNTAIKLGFEALRGTELADPWGLFRLLTPGRKSRKSCLLEQLLRITCISQRNSTPDGFGLYLGQLNVIYGSRWSSIGNINISMGHKNVALGTYY